jgi:hypothetical protein
MNVENEDGDGTIGQRMTLEQARYHYLLWSENLITAKKIEVTRTIKKETGINLILYYFCSVNFTNII